MSNSGTASGCQSRSAQVKSRMPSSSPVAGSWIGVAVQVNAVAADRKCSAPKTWNGRPVASAVPTPLVPANSSLHSAPGSRCARSATRSVLWSPSTHRRWPSASLRNSSCPGPEVAAASERLSTGQTLASGCDARRSASAWSSNGTGGK